MGADALVRGKGVLLLEIGRKKWGLFCLYGNLTPFRPKKSHENHRQKRAELPRA